MKFLSIIFQAHPKLTLEILTAQIKAAIQVNRQLLNTY